MQFDITLGSQPLPALRKALNERGVKQNTYSEKLLGSPLILASTPTPLTVKIRPIADLDLPGGATMDELLDRAAEFHLGPCPLEAALHLRLAWQAQPIGPRVTITSRRLVPSEQHPRGFYLRRDADGLWLRGYVASNDWIFPPEELVALAVDD